MLTTQRWLLVGFAALGLAGAAAAQSKPIYPVELPPELKDYRATYQACGCADSCWNVYVTTKKKPVRKVARLNCDCEKLTFQPLPGGEKRELPDKCGEFGMGARGKFERINEDLVQQMAPPAAKQ